MFLEYLNTFEVVDLSITTIEDIEVQIKKILGLTNDSKILIKLLESKINQFIKLESLNQLKQEHIILKIYSDTHFLSKTSFIFI